MATCPRRLDQAVYGHLMVPVDDSVLSSVNAEAAVQLAARLGARITFFHAAPDLGATRAGARLKSNDPRAFAESAFGDTHAMLAKYAVSAEALGVPYKTLTRRVAIRRMPSSRRPIRTVAT